MNGNMPHKTFNWKGEFEKWLIHKPYCCVNQKGLQVCDSDCRNIFEGKISLVEEKTREEERGRIIEVIKNMPTATMDESQNENTICTEDLITRLK